jgi:PncC family amidohydrolase
MKSIILSVGDELALGQTVDTNSAWISQQLAAVGCDIAAHLTVPDDQRTIEQAIAESAGRCDFLIISGGIGPTADDLTRQALAAVMRVPLEPNEAWLHRLEAFFRKVGRPMPESNQIQAQIPRGATIIENTAGTAAGIDATLGEIPPAADVPAHDAAMPPPPLDQLQGRPLGRVLTKMGKITREQVVEALNKQKLRGGPIGQILIASGAISEVDLHVALAAQKGQKSDQLPGEQRREQMFGQPPLPPLTPPPRSSAGVSTRYTPECRVFVMPGVPKEMKAMFTRDVLPHIAASTGGAVILSRTLHTFGMGESWIAEKLGELMMRQKNPSVGTTVTGGVVSVRINARYPSRDEAQQKLDATTAACEAALGDLVFGRDGQNLAEVVAALLASSRKTVATAESCTGGLLAKMLTDIPGSSGYFQQGWITYSNKAKTERLGVSENVLNVHGAVSEPVVDAMARAARRLAKADYALAISGIAGPSGGTESKPVGTVCIALASAKPAASAAGSPERKLPNSIDSTVLARTFTFPGDREMIRDRAAKMALAMLRFHLMGKPMPF